MQTRQKRGGTATSSQSPPRVVGEVNLKIMCVGAAATGKTTFLKYWETKETSHAVRTTISMEFHKHEMDIFLPAPNVAPSASSFLPPQQTGCEDADSQEAQSPSAAIMSRESSIVRDTSSNFGSSETRRMLTAPFRLTVPTTRTDFGPGTECRRAIVKVWDIQGQEHSKIMTRNFYSGALGAMVFCELTSNSESLMAAVAWKQDIDSKVRVAKQNGQEETIPCWLVVNKFDLLKEASISACPPWASHHELDQFVLAHKFVGWSYASGLKGINVLETVSAVVSRCAERFPEEIRNVATGPATGSGILLQRPRKPANKKSDCC